MRVRYEVIMIRISLAHTHSECFLGPVAAADDDGIGATHGADVLQARASTHGHSGHSEVLNTQSHAATVELAQARPSK